MRKTSISDSLPSPPWEEKQEEILSLFPEPSGERDPNLALVLEFEFLPSWNDAISAAGHGFAFAGFVKKWRERAQRQAVRWAKANGIPTETYLVTPRATKSRPNPRPEEFERLARVYLERPVKVLCRLWRPDSKIYDVHNICLKPIFDGFGDARLIYGDDTKWIREAGNRYEGIDRSLVLTADEKKTRATIQASRKERGAKPKRFPNRARFRLEFTYL